EHEICLQSLCPQPAAHPVRVARDVRTPCPLEMSRQGRGDAVRKALQLIVVRVSAAARAGSMEKHEMRHAPSLSDQTTQSLRYRGAGIAETAVRPQRGPAPLDQTP